MNCFHYLLIQKAYLYYSPEWENRNGKSDFIQEAPLKVTFCETFSLYLIMHSTEQYVLWRCHEHGLCDLRSSLHNIFSGNIMLRTSTKLWSFQIILSSVFVHMVNNNVFLWLWYVLYHCNVEEDEYKNERNLNKTYSPTKTDSK